MFCHATTLGDSLALLRQRGQPSTSTASLSTSTIDASTIHGNVGNGKVTTNRPTKESQEVRNLETDRPRRATALSAGRGDRAGSGGITQRAQGIHGSVITIRGLKPHAVVDRVLLELIVAFHELL